MLKKLKNIFRNLWFRDISETNIHINDTAVRVRAGILLIIPIYMVFTLVDAVFGSSWEVVVNTSAVDTYETNWDDKIIYQVEATKRVFDYAVQTKLLLYALLEMLAGMFVWSSRLSPTILLASLLTSGNTPTWKPIEPKRCAWTLGASFIAICIVFFNPDTIAIWVNSLLGTSIPTDENYIPSWLVLNLVWICLSFMWLESILGFCAGCKVHAGLVKLGLVKHECAACNEIDWDEIKRKKQQRLAQQKKP